MTLLIEIGSDEDHWAGAYGPLLVVFWKRDMPPALCKKLAPMAAAHAVKQRGGKIGVVTIPLPTLLSPPSSEARKALASLIRDSNSTVDRVAILREGGGFLASAIASVIIGIQLIARPQYGHRFFSSLLAALHWVTEGLAEFSSGEVQVTDVIAAIEQQHKHLLSGSTLGPTPPQRSAPTPKQRPVLRP